jgi:hypothetical protein
MHLGRWGNCAFAECSDLRLLLHRHRLPGPFVPEHQHWGAIPILAVQPVLWTLDIASGGGNVQSLERLSLTERGAFFISASSSLADIHRQLRLSTASESAANAFSDGARIL